MLVRGAVNFAKHWGVSPLLIGLTIVGFGTSTPELMVSINAALQNQPDIAVGNIVGSNIANTLLILGVSGMIQPISCPREMVSRDGSWMLAASILLVVLCLSGVIVFWQGAVMLAFLAVYVAYSYWVEKYKKYPVVQVYENEAKEFEDIKLNPWLSFILIIAGLVVLIYGARILVDGAVSLARSLGVSEAVIGLSLVAVGTSLPELATSLIAAFRKHADVAIGNIIGSNIFNILGILGTTAVVKTIPINPQIKGFDIWVMLGTACLIIPFMVTGKQISRKESSFLLVLYVAYIYVIYTHPPSFL